MLKNLGDEDNIVLISSIYSLPIVFNFKGKPKMVWSIFQFEIAVNLHHT